MNQFERLDILLLLVSLKENKFLLGQVVVMILKIISRSIQTVATITIISPGSSACNGRDQCDAAMVLAMVLQWQQWQVAAMAIIVDERVRPDSEGFIVYFKKKMKTNVLR